jgi:RHS repeat-associated protein
MSLRRWCAAAGWLFCVAMAPVAYAVPPDPDQLSESGGTAGSAGGSDAAVAEGSGAATLSIPIEAPRGTGGFQPQLGLRYSSLGEDGPFGVGWSLQLGEIRRAVRFGTPTYDDNLDRYELDGELLVPKIGESGRFHTQTESFRRILFTTNGWAVTFPNGNKARFGWNQETRIRVGGDTDPTNDDGGIFRWLLTELEDVNGNVIRFRYERSIDSGTAYPKTIEYSYRSGSPVGPTRKIEFVLGSRPDQQIRFSGKVLSRSTQRVTEIVSSVGTTPFRRLRLYYDEDEQTTGRSRLTSSRLFGSNCPANVSNPETNCADAMPPQTYTYSDAVDVIPSGTSTHWAPDSSSTTPTAFDADNTTQGPGRSRGVQIGDVNGDGWSDLVQAWIAPAETYRVYLGSPAGFSSQHDPAWTAALQSLRYTRETPQVTWSGTSWTLNCGVLQRDAQRKLAFTRVPSGNLPPAQIDEAQLVDLNGDGLSDIILSVAEGPCESHSPNYTDFAVRLTRAVWINTGTGWERDEALSDVPAPFRITSYRRNGETTSIPGVSSGQSGAFAYTYPLGTALVDLNGDGRLDLVSRSSGSYSGPAASYQPPDNAWLNTEAGWAEAPEGYLLPQPLTMSFQPIPPAGGEPRHKSGETAVRFADLNSDGLTDLIKSAVGGATGGVGTVTGVWLNNGAGWCSDSSGPCGSAQKYRLPAGTAFARFKNLTSSTPQVVIDSSLVLADLNGDGFVDLLRADGTENPGIFAAWIHDPALASVWNPAPEFAPPSSMPLQIRDLENNQELIYRAGVRLFDVDSNGTPDLVKNYDGNQYQFRSRATLADRLVVHRNGRGARWEFSYESAPRQRDESLETEARAHAVEFSEETTGIARWFATPVVTEMRVHSGEPGEEYVYEYAYAGSRWCPGLRSGLGFRLVDKSQPDGSLARVLFYQAHGIAGRASRRSIWSGSHKLWQIDSVWTRSYAQNEVDQALDIYVGRIDSESERALYDAGAGATRTVDFEYDDTYGFNFVSAVQVRRPTGNLDIVRAPEPADLTRWIVGLVDSETRQWGGVVYSKAIHQYDSRGRLVRTDAEIRDRVAGAALAGTATTRWSYDEYGNVDTRTDPGNRVERFCHDGDAAAGTESCPTGGVGAHAVLADVQDKLGEWTRVTSDAATGDVRGLVRFNGDAVTIEADGFGRPYKSLVDPAGDVGLHVLEKREHFDGTDNGASRPYVETIQYAKAGELGGIRTATYFDGLGRVVREVRPSETGWFGNTHRYDYAGRPIWQTLDQGCGSDPHCLGLSPYAAAARVVTYDRLGRPLTEASPLGIRAFGYGRHDRGGVAYDGVLVKEPRGSLVQRVLDGDRTAWVEECDNTVSAAAQSPGTSCAAPAVTTYSYEPTGELRLVRDALGFDLTYAYDTLGRTRSIDDPNATAATVMTYFATGTVASSTNARGQATTYAYDALDRVTDITRPAGESAVHVDYDPASRGPSWIREGPAGSPVQTIDIEYDAFGREARRALTVAQRTLVADFRYDLLDRIEEVVYPNGWTAVYSYQGAYFDSVCGRAPEASSGCGPTYVNGTIHDALGRVTRTSMASVQVDRAYHPSNQLPTSLKVTKASTRLLDLAYSAYDEAGNIERINDLRPGAQADGIDATATYTYHPHRDWLASHDLGGEPKYFQYDTVGNLIGRDLASPSDPPNQPRKPSFPHRLDYFQRGATQTVLAYDDDGNVKQRGSSDFFRYDSESRLTCVGTAAGLCNDALYRYDPLGKARTYESTAAGERIYLGELFEWHKGSASSTMHILVDGRRVATVERQNDTLVASWLPPFFEPPVPWWLIRWSAMGLLAVTLLVFAARLGVPAQATRRPLPVAVSLALMVALVPGQVARATPPPPGSVVKRWFVEDHLGSATLVLDENGNVVDRKVFEPFGKVFKEPDPPTITAPRFTGKRVAAESGLYDFGARWYDPEIGRFQQIDPIVQSPFAPVTLNAYAYAGNNPVNNVDPDGRGFVASFLGFLEGIAPLLLAAGAFAAVGAAAAAGAASTVTTVACVSVSAAGPCATTAAAMTCSTIVTVTAGAMSPALAIAAGAGGAAAAVALSTIPFVGETMDALVLADPAASGLEKTIAGVSLAANTVFPVLPNFGAVSRIASATGDIAGSVARGGARSVDDLVKAAQSKFPGKAGKIEQHHVTPKYLGGDPKGPTVPIDAAYHQEITNAFRAEWEFGRGMLPSEAQLRDIMQRVYERFPLPGQ